MKQRLGSYMMAEDFDGERWLIRNRRSRDVLGYVEYFRPWKQYVFQPTNLTEFSSDCLVDIASFLQTLRNPQQATTVAT